ncbi:hypothetical protein Y032_0007g3502 [Ancylostoma ceylanicum]|uniref:Uncharacterized protein n=1 Tax=Ancylostoma ceylanicum TaxID=53326 RepID=A0A016VND0_9BILA|nr:hypothetical protein Y032_0007g3502 [Ancylostoma ceylanicum]
MGPLMKKSESALRLWEFLGWGWRAGVQQRKKDQAKGFSKKCGCASAEQSGKRPDTVKKCCDEERRK